MDNETNKGANTDDTGAEKAGSHEQTGGGEAGSQSASGGLLDQTAEAVGARDSKSETTGATTDGLGSREWGISSSWNAGLLSVPPRPLEQREHLWASDLYSAPIDVWMKMRAVPYTNPPNERSRMKFEAAHIVEWIIGAVLSRAGILKGEEIRAEYQFPGLLKVTGRMDKLAGGKPDYAQAEAEIQSLRLPEGFMLAAKETVLQLQKQYPEGLIEMPIEIKSVSSFAMDAMEKRKISIKRHRVQLYHYLISKGYPVGKLVYYCRDDARLIEFTIALDSPVREEYKSRIELLTKNHTLTEPPPKDPMLVWEDDFGKFSKNLNVEYSPYLTKVYGFEKPRDYSEIWGKKATNWNRVLKRLKDGDKMTDKNEIILEEIRAEGYNPVLLASQMPSDLPEEEEVA